MLVSNKEHHSVQCEQIISHFTLRKCNLTAVPQCFPSWVSFLMSHSLQLCSSNCYCIWKSDSLLWLKRFLINRFWKYMSIAQISCVENYKKTPNQSNLPYLFKGHWDNFWAFIKYTGTPLSPQNRCPDHLLFKWKHESVNQGTQGKQQQILSIVKY